jgi:hypothetical protein
MTKKSKKESDATVEIGTAARGVESERGCGEELTSAQVPFPARAVRKTDPRAARAVHRGIARPPSVRLVQRRHRNDGPTRGVLPRSGSGRDVRFIVRPPHRTVRAAFPHTAPTSGV